MNNKAFKILNKRKLNNNKNTALGLIGFIEILTKLLPIFSLLALVFGGMVTYTYLDSINQTAIFPDILTSPSALFPLILVFLGLSLCFLFSLITPYFVPQYLGNQNIPLFRNKEGWVHESHYINLIIFSVVAMLILILEIIFDSYVKYTLTIIICLIYMMYVLFYNVSIGIITNLLVASIISFCLICLNGQLKVKYAFSLLSGIFVIFNIWKCGINPDKLKIKQIENLLMVLYLVPLLFLTATLFFILMAVNIADASSQNDVAWYLFIVLVILWLLAYTFNGYIAFSLYEKENKFEIKNLFIPCMLFFLFSFVLVLFDKGRQLQRFILKPLHFIEYPSNANWYTIDTRLFAPNNLNNQEIERHSKDLLAYFYSKQFETQCKYISDEKTKKQCEQSESEFQTQQKYNRFYGYVAWNLGDIKVFCPHGYEQARLKFQKEKNSNPIQCLALKSEYIIPYY